MKKKIAAILLMIALIPGLAFAADFVQLGVNAQIGFPLEKWEQLDTLNFKDVFKPENVYYGPQLKLNLFFVDIDETLAMQYANGGFQMRNDLFADLYFKLFFVRINAGVGIQTQLMHADKPIEYPNFMGMIDSSFMTYRAGLGFCFGPVELNLQYMAPGSTPIMYRDQFYKPAWERSTIGLSLLFSLT